MEESGESTLEDGASPADGDVKPDPMDTDAADAETSDAAPKEATETSKAEVDADAVTDTPAVDGEGGTKDADGNEEADKEKDGAEEGKDGPGSPGSMGDEPPSKKAKVGPALLMPRVLCCLFQKQVEFISCAVMPSSPSIVSCPLVVQSCAFPALGRADHDQ